MRLLPTLCLCENVDWRNKFNLRELRMKYRNVHENLILKYKPINAFPIGLSDSDVQSFKHRVSHLPVSEMHSPKWNRCGRAKNQYVVLSDGTAMCARYRDPHNKLIYGALNSSYFPSKFLPNYYLKDVYQKYFINYSLMKMVLLLFHFFFVKNIIWEMNVKSSGKKFPLESNVYQSWLMYKLMKTSH